jgi:uncharacterized protein
VQTFRIIRESIRPALAKGAVGVALSAGADQIMAAASGPAASAAPARLAAAPPQKAQDDGPSVWLILLLSLVWCLFILGLILWLIRRASRRGQQPRGSGKMGRVRAGAGAAAYAAGSTWDSSAGAASYSSWDNSSSSSSYDSGSSSSSDSGGFDSGGGSSGGGGSDSSY